MKRVLAMIALALPLTLQARVQVKVLPNPASVTPGGSIRFEAKVTDSLGNPVRARIEWHVTPDKLGRISPDGLFLAANHEGKGIVRAVAKLLTQESGTPKNAIPTMMELTDEAEGVGHAVVRVRRGPNQGMVVRVMPKRAFVKVGQTQQFDVKVVGPDGEPIKDARLVFKINPPDVGAITQKGLFTAGDEIGKCRIIVLAKKGDLEGIGQALAVVGDPERHLPVTIRPKHVALKPGGTQKFEFEIPERSSNAEPRAKWKVMPRELGTITADGVFTAGRKPGKGFVAVIVKLGDKVGADRAVVVVGKPRKIRVKIYPKRAHVEPGQSFKFRAMAFDEQGNPLRMPLKWIVRPKEAGRVTPEGLFTAGDRPGKCKVIAQVLPRFGIGQDDADVVIQKKLIVKIRPNRASIEPKKSQKFEAQVFDQQGNLLRIQVRWMVRPGEAGTITPDGLFTAGDKPGRCEVIAVVPPRLGIGRGIAPVAIGIQRKLRVEVKPRLTRVPVSGTQRFAAQAFDEAGNPVQVRFLWKLDPSEAGKLDETGLFQAGRKPGKCRVIAIVEPSSGVGKGLAAVEIY
jgi:hypothetical protein